MVADHQEVKARSLGVDQVIDEVLGRALLAHHRVAYLCQLRTSLRSTGVGRGLYPFP